MILTWTGSDVLYATSYPKQLKKTKYIYCLGCKIFAKIADLFVHCHIVVSEHLIDELKPLHLKKSIYIRPNPLKYLVKYPKKAHNGFNVLYYRGISNNHNFVNWLYGYDIILQLKKDLPKINIIEITGNADLTEMFPIIDFYARPNRHDGEPRLTRECIIQDIPFYHSYSNPSLKKLKQAIYELAGITE